jgi:hypothetical protein
MHRVLHRYFVETADMTRPQSKSRDDDRTKHRAGHQPELLARLANHGNIAAPDDADADAPLAFTVAEFCKRHRLSVQLFYKYEGRMPATFYIGKRRFISREAAARWRAEQECASAKR